jgi:hypothetical protein
VLQSSGRSCTRIVEGLSYRTRWWWALALLLPVSLMMGGWRRRSVLVGLLGVWLGVGYVALGLWWTPVLVGWSAIFGCGVALAIGRLFAPEPGGELNVLHENSSPAVIRRWRTGAWVRRGFRWYGWGFLVASTVFVAIPLPWLAFVGAAGIVCGTACVMAVGRGELGAHAYFLLRPKEFDHLVADLVARSEEFLDTPANQLVLTGSGVGAHVAYAAATRLREALPAHQFERVGLVVAGASYADQDLVDAMGGRLRILCRGTDTWGGIAESHGDDLQAVTRRDSGAIVHGSAHWLPDPQVAPIVGKRWTPGINGHRNYTADPEWDHAIAIAASLANEKSTLEVPMLPGMLKLLG